MEMLWDKLMDIAKFASIVAGFLGGAVTIYITARLAPILVKLQELADRIETVSHDREKEDERINKRCDSIERRVDGVEKDIPNCEVKRAEINRDINDFKSGVRIDIVEKLAKISEANIQFRDDIRRMQLGQVEEWTREGITRGAVEKIARDVKDDIRRELKREVESLKERIDKQGS
jgi:hypothetical protein